MSFAVRIFKRIYSYTINIMNKTEFQNSNLFEIYDVWINNMIADDYYSPELYDDDGNIISEASFDEDSFMNAKDEILDISISIYEEIAYGDIFKNHPVDLSSGKIIDHASIISDMLQQHDYSDAALLGTIYFLFVYDYPNYEKFLGNKKLFMRIYNELFTKVSVYINCINEWLNLYSSLRDITSVLALPPCMREKDVLSCLNKLRKYGILDDSYQVTARARKGSFRQLIGQHLYIKGCKWHILEEHFNESNLRVHSDLDRFKNRMSKNEAQDWEVEIYKLIEECFV